jgi:uncharacterized protein with GYD domain
MAYFLLQGAYTSESWKSLVNNPVNRVEVVRPIIEKLGGKIESAFFAFGEYDIIIILQMPDNVSAAAFSLAVASAGTFKSSKTTPLLTMEEGIESLKKAGKSGYLPPK